MKNVKKLSLEDLKVESFVTSLTQAELNENGGTTTEYTGVTSKCNPSTDESTVSTCACGTTDCQQACPPR